MDTGGRSKERQTCHQMKEVSVIISNYMYSENREILYIIQRVGSGGVVNDTLKAEIFLL